MSLRFSAPLLVVGGLALTTPAHAQAFRFDLRAEPSVIPANGLSTTSIFVQLPQSGAASIAQAQTVRFATTAGTIESQAVLSGGVARVLLRSSSTPETATVTAFVGSARETITVEFAEDTGMRERYLEVDSPYVAYGNGTGIVTSSGKTSMDFGNLHIESDVRLDIDLNLERIWAQGNSGGVIISNGRGGSRVELRGDRLFYDLRKRQGVIRRSTGDNSNTSTGARQEFVGAKFEAPPPLAANENAPIAKPADLPSLVAPPQAPTSSPQGRDNLAAGSGVPIKPAVTPETKTEETPAQSDGKNQQPAKADDTATPVTPSAPVAAPESQKTEPTSTDSSLVAAPPASNNSLGIPDPSIVPSTTPENPAPLVQDDGTRSNLLFTPPKPSTDAPALRNDLPNYQPLPQSDITPRIVELQPPNFNVGTGYWVTARRLRVFPRDKVQFERASIYFNGGKAFGMPLYVLPLDGSFNPQTDMVSFNSSGGFGLRIPYYYQASKGGTGAIFFNNSMRSGFGTQTSGPSLELQQQYWLNPRSHGSFSLDQIGRGNFNVNFSHVQQLDNRTVANFYLNAPRHRDIYARATVARDLANMQIGFEGFFDRPQDQDGNLRGQFFARMRPKTFGKTGWNYSLSANALAVQRVPFQLANGGTVGGAVDGEDDGGISVPRPGDDPGTGTTTRYRSMIGQTLNASFNSPTYSPWRGATFNANLLATAYNYSDKRRGLAPGVNLSFAQALGKKANLSLAYTYDRSSIGLYGATSTSFTHYFTANLYANVSKQIAISAFASRSLTDKSLYGSAGIDYFFAPKWRVGAFLDYANFSLSSSQTLTTGWSLGRTIGNRELALNYDTLRQKVYVSYGGAGLY